MAEQPKLTAELIELILATASPNCWIAVARSDFRLVAAGNNSLEAVQAAEDNGFGSDSILLLWSAGANQKRAPGKAGAASTDGSSSKTGS